MYSLRKIWNPQIYQGAYRKKDYFEGWYFKLVSSDGKSAVAIIPGISRKSRDESHAFIQIIEGDTGKTMYFEYPGNEFYFSKKKLEIIINTNYFSESRMNLDIQEKEYCIQGNIDFIDTSPLKSSLFNPGIMGWYSFVPFMECYHGLVSLDHSIDGGFRINGDEYDFSGGKGYTEKDWGQSFPSSWIWMQSNHFNQDKISFSFSIARIPWLKNHFIGHIGILLFNNKQYRFATYNGSIVQSLKIEDNTCVIVLKRKKLNITIRATRKSSGTLLAPQVGVMDRRISESIDSEVEVALTDSKDNTIFEARGVAAGLELAGDLEELKELN